MTLSSLDWGIRYTVSRATVLQIGPGGELLARNSVSRQPQVLAFEALPVLLAFADPSTPRDALARLRNEWEVEEDGFAAVVTTLVAQNLLTPAGEGEAAPAAGGFASVRAHYSLVRDSVRVMSYHKAISRHCQDRTVVEIGCGLGILSIFAAQAGARRVIAIEESSIADQAEEMFRVNGVADRIELRRANSRDVSLDQPADVLIHEIIGSDPFSENVLPFLDDARKRLLKPGGRMIPYALEVRCVGFEVPERPYLDRARAGAELTELERLYGLDFSPLRSAFDSFEPEIFLPPLGDLGQTTFAPRILTDEARLYRLNFTARESLAVESDHTFYLRVREAGSLGGVLVYFRAQLDEHTVLTNSPYHPRTSWDWDARPLDYLIAVEPGLEIPIATEIRTVLGVERLHVGLA